ncbi:MAG: hypothetical protein ACRDNO_01215 [Trebonia sp.]
MHEAAPLLVKSMIVKSVPAPAPPLATETRRSELEHAAAPAGAALVCVAVAGLDAWPEALLVAVLAAETLELGVDAWLVVLAGALELCDAQPTARIDIAATIPAVSEFRTICTLSVISAIPSSKEFGTSGPNHNLYDGGPPALVVVTFRGPSARQ